MELNKLQKVKVKRLNKMMVELDWMDGYGFYDVVLTVKDDLFVAFPFISGSISCPLKRCEFDLPHITYKIHITLHLLTHFH